MTRLWPFDSGASAMPGPEPDGTGIEEHDEGGCTLTTHCFADAGALYAAAADGWRQNLEALARHETTKPGRECVAAALAFVLDGWAALLRRARRYRQALARLAAAVTA